MYKVCKDGTPDKTFKVQRFAVDYAKAIGGTVEVIPENQDQQKTPEQTKLTQ